MKGGLTGVVCGLLLSPGLACAASTENTVVAVAPIIGSDGSPHGTAMLLDAGHGLTLELKATGLTPGMHGAHLHTTGACDPPTFASAGAHLNPMGKMHGTLSPQGSHLGDLPNLTIAADGTGSLIAQLPGTWATLKPVLFDTDGTAIVIHAAPDDYRTDPSGNSGSRIACGVFKSKG